MFYCGIISDENSDRLTVDFPNECERFIERAVVVRGSCGARAHTVQSVSSKIKLKLGLYVVKITTYVIDAKYYAA